MYKDYTDVNGVKWTIIQAPQAFSAYVADDETRKYIPDAPDIQPVPRVQGEEGSTEQAEADRQRYVMLRAKIDAYAADHKANVGLQVTATAPAGVPWWVYLVGFLVLAKRKR